MKTLKKYRDVFASSYKDFKGVDSDICQHTISMREDAKPSRQRPYTYNDTFARKIKEEIDKPVNCRVYLRNRTHGLGVSHCGST